MPVIGRIKGIIMRMFFGDYAPPHFHATDNEKEGLFKISDLNMFKGDLPPKEQRTVKKWAEPRQSKLQDMWDSQDIKNID
jgi:hypothetical protein